MEKRKEGAVSFQRIIFYSSPCESLFCYDIIVQVIMGEPIAASLGTDGVFCFSPINHVPGQPVKETHVLIRNPLLQPLLATRCCSCPVPSSQVFKEWWAYLCFNMDIVAFITWVEWHLKIFREDQDTPRYLMELLSNGSLQVGKRDYFKCLDLLISKTLNALQLFSWSVHWYRQLHVHLKTESPWYQRLHKGLADKIWYFRKWKCSADPKNVVQCKKNWLQRKWKGS